MNIKIVLAEMLAFLERKSSEGFLGAENLGPDSWAIYAHDKFYADGNPLPGHSEYRPGNVGYHIPLHSWIVSESDYRYLRSFAGHCAQSPRMFNYYRSTVARFELSFYLL